MTSETWVEKQGLSEYFEILLLPCEGGRQNAHTWGGGGGRVPQPVPCAELTGLDSFCTNGCGEGYCYLRALAAGSL